VYEPPVSGDCEEPFDFEEFVEGLWAKAPVAISRDTVDEGLTKAGLKPATARKLARILVDQEGRRVVCPEHDPPATMRIVSDYLRRAVDELIDAGAPLQVVECVCEGIPGYVLKKIEDAKRAKRAADQKPA
jgi:hypothetical protein